MKVHVHIRRFLKCESGATAIEYGLIAALIGVGAIVGMSTLGSGNEEGWKGLSSNVKTQLDKY